jgi:hypothetical protein
MQASEYGHVKLLVHILKYKHIDIRTLSCESIPAIVYASRFNSEAHIQCIKALLQAGSELSDSFLAFRSKEQFHLIQSVAFDLLNHKK